MLLQEWFLLHFSAFQTSTEVAYDFDICEILAYDSYCVYGLTITVVIFISLRGGTTPNTS